MNTVIIQPPLVQLNTPYPSGAYLLSFFRKTYEERHLSGKTEWLDLSIALFHEIFSEEGLRKLFSLTENDALIAAQKAEDNYDDDTAFQIRRYISEQDLWCSWIDIICEISCSSGRFSGKEYKHEFVRSAHIPRGMRMERYLSEIGKAPSADDSEVLASLALADIADYITAIFDNNFSLIRYAESAASSDMPFSKIEEASNSPVMKYFYEPLLKRLLSNYINIEEKTLFCISLPFPGTVTAALFTAKFIKKQCGHNAIIAFGGGFINTELRNTEEKKLFDYIDFISYDRGYGSYLSLLDKAKSDQLKNVLNGEQFYKIKYIHNGKIINPLWSDEFYEKKEDLLTKEIIPEFSEIDFSRYPRLADTDNPMQRIWSDGAWMKLFLAYGCYWHKCAFCDTSLEYVNHYCKNEINNLFYGIKKQAKKTGVYGLHFVDEACPPVSLEKFALLNCMDEQKPRFTFWGNIRFEKTFTKDLVDLLSYGGLTGVSAGIEIATGNGLCSVNKGTDMQNIVSACCAFKEAGILIHSYMIFGFWNQSEQDLIDSMETLRQFFEEGLLDSAFWHKFTLTLHSTVYFEWKEGKHPDLKPLPQKKNSFSENTIHYEGENKSEKYSYALNNSLSNWMKGNNLSEDVRTWFDFKMPLPSIKKNFIHCLVNNYEKEKNKQFANTEKGFFIWIGGKVIILKSANESCQLSWTYMGELLYADVTKNKAETIAKLLYSMKPENCSKNENDSLGMSTNELIDILGKEIFVQLRGKGLCKLLSKP